MTEKPLPTEIGIRHERQGKSCCCNCIHQFRIMRHPSNKKFARGSVMDELGWACDLPHAMDGNNTMIFFSTRHGECEMHQPIKPVSK